MSKSVRSFLAFLTFTFLFSCKPNIDIPQPSAGDADFTKTVALGGNYLSGYQDGALYQKGQELSIPALLAKQFELVGGSSFPQSFVTVEYGIGINSKLWETPFVSKSTLGYKINCEGEQSLSPLKTLLISDQITDFLTGKDAGTQFQNFAIPFARIKDILNPAFSNSFAAGNLNPYFSRFAKTQGVSTLLKDANEQNPTFSVLWLGMEDIYDYARNGGFNSSILSSSDFSLYLDTILSQLTAAGSKGVIANIPDLNSFPFYTLIPPRGLDLTQNQADSLNNATGNIFEYVEGENGFPIADPNTFSGFRQMGEGENLLLTVPLDSMKCHNMGTLITIPGRYSLDYTEVDFIQGKINEYNTVIAQKAVQYNLALVDMNSYFKKIKEGIKWNGADFNAEFVSGGFYSLDGFHPNQKGYALIANEFILAINQTYNSVIPTVHCQECSGVKFP